MYAAAALWLFEISVLKHIPFFSKTNLYTADLTRRLASDPAKTVSGSTSTQLQAPKLNTPQGQEQESVPPF